MIYALDIVDNNFVNYHMNSTCPKVGSLSKRWLIAGSLRNALFGRKKLLRILTINAKLALFINLCLDGIEPWARCSTCAHAKPQAIDQRLPMWDPSGVFSLCRSYQPPEYLLLTRVGRLHLYIRRWSFLLQKIPRHAIDLFLHIQHQKRVHLRCSSLWHRHNNAEILFLKGQ